MAPPPVGPGPSRGTLTGPLGPDPGSGPAPGARGANARVCTRQAHHTRRATIRPHPDHVGRGIQRQAPHILTSRRCGSHGTQRQALATGRRYRRACAVRGPRSISRRRAHSALCLQEWDEAALSQESRPTELAPTGPTAPKPAPPDFATPGGVPPLAAPLNPDTPWSRIDTPLRNDWSQARARRARRIHRARRRRAWANLIWCHLTRPRDRWVLVRAGAEARATQAPAGRAYALA